MNTPKPVDTRDLARSAETDRKAPVKSRAQLPRTLYRRVKADARAAGMTFSERVESAIKRELVAAAAR